MVPSGDSQADLPSWENALNDLESGKLRAASPQEDGTWVVNINVKQSILDAFKAGKIIQYRGFVDKHSLLPQELTPDRGVRVVPGGTSIRRGAYLAPGVIIMPPSYINVGAYVDEGTMVDSHCLVGSCAQIGKRIHLSAGVQIGGVLEPIGMAPVIIEDDCFIGAGSIIVEGIRIGKRAVIAPGVVLTKGVSVYDAVHNKVLERGSAIPAGAVVVPGSRPLLYNEWTKKQQLQLNCPIIVKYRDEKSDASITLEDALRC